LRFGIWNVGACIGQVHVQQQPGVQEVRWDKGGTVRAGDYNFSMEKETKVIIWEQDFFAHHRILSAVKRVQFVSDRVSYIVLRGRWCNIIVPNVHAPSEENSDDSKDSFYEELEQVFFIIFVSTI